MGHGHRRIEFNVILILWNDILIADISTFSPLLTTRSKVWLRLWVGLGGLDSNRLIKLVALLSLILSKKAPIITVKNK